MSAELDDVRKPRLVTLEIGISFSMISLIFVFTCNDKGAVGPQTGESTHVKQQRPSLVLTLLIQKTIASSRSKGKSLEALKLEKRLTLDTTCSTLIISTM
ncbi:hypothetical protein EYF80_034261 [Liparis tanakae]|uniref:Uncharacterized protein n=1 Tax=Liparis tanakae TaxID=230148 RepID=A0A4Z2GQ76_9TELE|nr:hypothetical protein EYF80_034261 [Liparis tanakae]